MIYLKYLKKSHRKEMFEISVGVYEGNEPRFISLIVFFHPIMHFVYLLWQQNNNQTTSFIKKNLRKNRDHLIYKITFILLLIKSVIITMPKKTKQK